ncbi:hypothetical protein M413DRAFT_390097 [Hebeloma cylindrosporum]|uniref:Uncharacterized protein n=1 Tax=Hebeloma cylindrosporum TaxID=76867 RepID=A0A0C3C4R0_HEBCY|nr:hypothetical protein M413DRAFT_390097 [Hebeloma cylindrosporum h7]
MYEYSRKIIFLLATSYALEVIPSTIIQILSDPKSGASSADLGPGGACLPLKSLWWANFFWLPIMVWEIITFGLCLRKGLQYRADSSKPYGILPLPAKSQSLAYIMLRDSIFFPLLGMTVCLINFIGGRYFTYTSKMIAVLLSAASAPVIGCRFVLNLREVYYRPFKDECEQGRMTTNLPIAFASSPREPNRETELDNAMIT